MLRERLLSSIVLIPLAAAVAWAGGWWFVGFVALFATVAAWEALRLLEREDFFEPVMWLGLVTVAGLVLEAGLQPDPLRFQAFLVLAVLLGLTVALFLNRPGAAGDWTLTLGIAVYLGLTLRFLALMRLLPDGLSWVTLAALTTWITDSGAYFIGKGIGKHKLWPRISPKKTWEGLLGGMAVGTTAAAFLGPWLLQGLTWPQGILIGLLIGIIGPIGDLSESLFKRQVGAKDSSTLIPGHGGFFDRADSFIFVSPIIYLLAKIWGR